MAASADRQRRRRITCACCGVEGEHRGHGWIIPCYMRWVYHGRPAGGPPPAGVVARKPNSTRGRKVREVCVRGHSRERLKPGASCPVCAADAGRRYETTRLAARRAGFREVHAEHDVGVKSDGRWYCRTCLRGDHDVDEMAVERAVAGEPPRRMSVAERELAVVELRRLGVSYEVIGQRLGCSLRTAWESGKRVREREAGVGAKAKRPHRSKVREVCVEAGHEVGEKSNGRWYCRTCLRGDHEVDLVVVAWAIGGEPPARMSVAERELAVMVLRRQGLTFGLIARRLRCSVRAVWSANKRVRERVARAAADTQAGAA